MLHPTIQAKLPLLYAAFKAHRIKSVYAFGSALNESFNADSDVDLVVNFEDDMEPIETGNVWWKLHDDLRKILDREVDILIEKSLKNPYLIEEINDKKELIYAA